MSDSIKVAIKVRPLIKREKDENLSIQWTVQGNSIVSTEPEMKKRGDGGFSFDHIFDMNASNSNVFDTVVKPIVNAAVNGFNGTVFAYGQTSSGKTYTMMGTAEEPGILPLAIDHMFDAITNTIGREFLLRVSYLEIYNEKVNDLLNKDGTDLKLKEDGSGQVVVQCKEEITNSPDNVLSIMKKGDKHRRIGETNMNERSSRSHTIFRITIESREAGGDSDGAIQVSQLNLVDLAGSERARQTGATGERFKEGRHINLSLSTLGLVIMQLSESQDGQKHVNFRDSKLTRLLQTSLGGNAMTAIICAVTPAALEETQCTLSFASRAKSVKNKPQINEVMSDATLLKRYAKQLTKLQQELQKIKNENRAAEVEEMESKLQEKERINQLLEERIELLKTRIVSGDNAGREESFKYKSKRRQTWGGPGMFNQHPPAFQPKAGLPTIKEVSFEKSHRKSIIQSMDIMNQTFQTAFTDFELELFESERNRESVENVSDSEEEPFVTKRKNRVTFRDDVMTIKSKNNSFDGTPEKCNTATQTASYQASPSTPKHVLRRCITDLTREFVELREFTTLEKQMLCKGNECCAHKDEGQTDTTPKCCEVEYTPDVKDRLARLDLVEEKDIIRIVTELCRKLNEIEEQNATEKEANRKAVKRFSDLEKQIENITSERNEFEYISCELRAELKKKTAELELKNISEESIRQEEMKKISELERQIESITAEKNKLERNNSELCAELTKSTTELQKQIEIIASERNEFEYIRRELRAELNQKSLELEKLKNDSEGTRVEVTNIKTTELEREIENVKSQKNEVERVNAELSAELKQTSLEFESKIALEQTAKQEAIDRSSELEKRIEEITLEKNEHERVSVESVKKIADLESAIESERAVNQDAIRKLSELEKQIANIVSEKNELEHMNKELQQELNEKTSAINENLASEKIESQEVMETTNEPEVEGGNITSTKDEYECIITELRAELNQKASDLELEQNESRKAVEKIDELNKQLETVISERDQFEHINNRLNVELNEKTAELESKIMTEQSVNSEAKDNVPEFEKCVENITSEKNGDESTIETDDGSNKNNSDLDVKSEQDYITENNNLKNYIKDLQEDMTNLQTENQGLKDQLGNQSPFSCSRLNESNADASYLILNMEAEKSQLEENLQLKSQELEDIKCDVRSLKTDIKKLQETVYLLTTENMEMATKLTTEQEDAKQTEHDLKKRIEELSACISKLTGEKIALESNVASLNEQIESMRSKRSTIHDTEQMLAYQSKIDTSVTDNMELSGSIAEEKETNENVKESTSPSHDHECLYKEKIAILTQKNESLLSENSELSSDLMDRIEENENLRDQCDLLKNKLEQSLAMNGNHAQYDLEHLKTENSSLHAEIADLKTKILILSTEKANLSGNLLETVKNVGSTRPETPNNSTLHLSMMFNNTSGYGEIKQEISEDNTPETLTNKILDLQNKIDYLELSNKNLSDLKLISCGQCAHLRNLNDNRKALELEAKTLNQKLEDLQQKFDQKCVDTETLKMKIDQALNSSEHEFSADNSLASEMNVSIIEDKIQNLTDELQTLRAEHDKLSVLYEGKCNEVEQLQNGMTANAPDTSDTSATRKSTSKNERSIKQIKTYIEKLRSDMDEMKKDSMNFVATLNKYKTEKANLLEEINSLKSTNEELQGKVSNNETTAMNRVQILENELSNMSKRIEEFSIREKEWESQRLKLGEELEALKVEQENKNATITELNAQISSLKSEVHFITSQRNELINSQPAECKVQELNYLRNKCDELEKEKVQSNESEQRNAFRIKELEAYINELQVNITNREALCREMQEKGVYLERLLQEREQEGNIFTQKLQAAEMEVVEVKNNLEMKYKIEFNSMFQQYQQHIKESENNLQKLNDTLNKYIDENLKLTQELTSLKSIKEKCNEIMTEKERASDHHKMLMDTNEKLKEELNDIRKCIIKELSSLKYNINSTDFSSKPITEMFIVLLQTLVSKEEEIIKTMRETYEKERRKLEDGKQQSIDAEKRATIWSKELEAEIERLQSELTERERAQKEHENKISQLDYLLRESTHERDVFKEKMEALEMDFNNLQAEFDKQCKVDSKQEEAIIVAQKREKEAQEILKNKEMELQSKLKSEKEMYEQKIENLVHTVESFKTKNLQLKSTIEGLGANENQLKNIIEANSTEIKRNNQNTEKIGAELEQLTLAYNEACQEMEQKNSHIAEITEILKNKCDMLSEYKSKLDSIVPEYEMLKEHVKDKKLTIERCKEEIEVLKREREEQLVIIKDKLNLEEIRNAGLTKQLNELNNRNVALIEELTGLKERYEELQQENAKLERKIRNSTSKIKAEADIEELKELNKKLQNNLEGASNRVTELQEIKNQTLKEFVDLKGKYELVLRENNELKTTLSSYKSNHSSSSLITDQEKYDALLLEKNKIALELEEKKLILDQKDKEFKEYANQIQELTDKNKELDQELDEYAEVIRERDTEISKLEEKLDSRLTENVYINELEAKLQSRNEENGKLRDQVEALKMRLQMDTEELQSQKEKLERALKKENLELQKQLDDYKKQIEMKMVNDGNSFKQVLTNELKCNCDTGLGEEKSRSIREYENKVRDLTTRNKELENKLLVYKETIRTRDAEIIKLRSNLHARPTESELAGDIKQKLEFHAAENSRLKNEIRELQMRSRIDLHNERSILKENQHKNVALDNNYKEYEEKCEQLMKKIRELELQLVSKNGKIATLEIQIQSENFPYQRKCKELEELVLAYRNKNAELSSNVRKLQRTVNDVNAWECDICRRWRVNRKDQACQTIPNNAVRLCSTSTSGVVEDHVKIQKLEREKTLMKDLCRARSRQIKELEDRIKELETQSSAVSRSNEVLQDRSNIAYYNRHIDVGKSSKA